MIPTDAPLVDYTEQCIEAALEIAGDPKHEIGPKRLALAWDIAVTAFVEPPLFADDEDRHKTIRFLVAVAWRESSIRQDVVGAAGECTMFQLKPAFLGLTCKELVKDAQMSTWAAMKVMRISFNLCGEGHELNAYAGGDKACRNPGAQAITDNRMKLAKDIEQKVGP